MSSGYLNNAASSFPKPASVADAVARCLASPPLEPGRSGGGDDLPAICRQELAALLRVGEAQQIALLPSATHALNQVLWGVLRGREHVVTTVLEHSSVLRPLAHLTSERGIEVTHVEADAEGGLHGEAVAMAMRPQTRLVVVNHASNVTGSIQPVVELAELCAAHDIPLLIDAAQSAGAITIAHEHLPGRVFIAFAGHKGLLGPTGVGGLIVPDDQLSQTIVGGTGIRSESLVHPPELPLRHEAGTPNLPGLAGLAAGLRFVRERGVEVEGQHRHDLVMDCRRRLAEVPGLRLLPLPGGDGRAGIVSFTMDGWSPAEVTFALRSSFALETRSGLHCAPLCHRFFGTAPEGTVRVSFGVFNDLDDVARLAAALVSLAEY
jgi:cysteine desulfurase family protein